MSEKLYEIYEVSYKGQVVYIGSGLQGVRHLHVKSGSSHNPDLNQLFFEDPSNILVQILRENLTKEESLEYEKEYIQATKPIFNIVHNSLNKGKSRSKKRVKNYLVNGN